MFSATLKPSILRVNYPQMPLGLVVLLCSLWQYDIIDNIWSHFLHFSTKMLQFALIPWYPFPFCFIIILGDIINQMGEFWCDE